METETHRWQEAWWCHYHGEIHIGTAEDWNDEHRSEMIQLYSGDDVERARKGEMGMAMTKAEKLVALTNIVLTDALASPDLLPLDKAVQQVRDMARDYMRDEWRLT